MNAIDRTLARPSRLAHIEPAPHHPADIGAEIADYALGLRLRAAIMILNALLAAYFAYDLSDAATRVVPTAEYPAAIEHADLVTSCVWTAAALAAAAIFCLMEARRSWNRAAQVVAGKH